MKLSEEFWDNQYKINEIGWDLGVISPPLKSYFDQLSERNLKILIPGGGNSYEAEYLFKNGFKNVFIVDISKTVLTNFKKRIPEFPSNQLIHNDFFDIQITFDLIIEQTFFCALNPNLRNNYALKINDLLKSKGKLIGLLFNVPLFKDHPPFGGYKSEYLTYFEPLLNIEIMEDCFNSIESRNKQELFIKLAKR